MAVFRKTWGERNAIQIKKINNKKVEQKWVFFFFFFCPDESKSFENYCVLPEYHKCVLPPHMNSGSH